MQFNFATLAMMAAGTSASLQGGEVYGAPEVTTTSYTTVGTTTLHYGDIDTTVTQTSTLYKTITLTSCAPDVTDCPAHTSTSTTSTSTSTTTTTTTTTTSTSSSTGASSYFPLSNSTAVYHPTVASTGFHTVPLVTASSYLPIKTGSTPTSGVSYSVPAEAPAPPAEVPVTPAAPASTTPAIITAGASGFAVKGGILAGSLALAMLAL
ncbi:hypothetical protein CFO_g1367 [Ceratocystis platani]|uniref:Uncharacterized protein n=1 Tax=Ceratocystis fimbriata f. sp. platani TaxID=88771 RepID=A0A0F8BUQ2_CERFI|nr:hypothetical protein CFO_g1367 [Ceratocystis platani]